MRSRRHVQARRSARGLAVLTLLGALAGCAAVPEEPGRGSLASVERMGGGITRVTLTSEAAERIGIETAGARAAAGGILVPYSAVIYDTKGHSYTYTNPEPLVYERSRVRVAEVRGERAVLRTGPEPGTTIVTIGASQLLGIELGIGIS